MLNAFDLFVLCIPETYIKISCAGLISTAVHAVYCCPLGASCKFGSVYAYSSLMMEAVRTSETSVDNHFTRQYNPEDSSEQCVHPL
jgi:hypothetical protein